MQFSVPELAGVAFWIENDRPYGSAFFDLNFPGGSGLRLSGGFFPVISGDTSFKYPFNSITFGTELLTAGLDLHAEHARWSASLSLAAGSSAVSAFDADIALEIPLAWSAEADLSLHQGETGIAISALVASARIEPFSASIDYAESDALKPFLFSGSLRFLLPFSLEFDLVSSLLDVPSGKGFFHGSRYLFLFGSILGEEQLVWSDIQASHIGCAVRGKLKLNGASIHLETGYDALSIKGDIALLRKDTRWISTGPFFWEGKYVDFWPVLAGTEFAEVPDGLVHFGLGLESPIGRNQVLFAEARQYLPLNFRSGTGQTLVPSIPDTTSRAKAAYGGLVFSVGWKWMPSAE